MYKGFSTTIPLFSNFSTPEVDGPISQGADRWSPSCPANKLGIHGLEFRQHQSSVTAGLQIDRVTMTRDGELVRLRLMALVTSWEGRTVYYIVQRLCVVQFPHVPFSARRYKFLLALTLI